MKRTVRAVLSAFVLVVAPAAASAQSLAYNSGQNVAPAYEGWEQDADGTKYFLFGYMNRNWEEELDVPTGPENGFSPGAADQGQPTHFLPRRNRFVFRVKVPQNFTPTSELIWTLTTNGVTEKAYASLRDDYKVDGVVKASETGALGAGSSSPEIRGNQPPVVKLEVPKTITAKVGVPVTLTAIVTDDGVPKRAQLGAFSTAGSAVGRSNAPVDPAVAAQQAQRLQRVVLGPPARVTVGKNVGLHLSWFEYRGPANAPVAFEPMQIKTWEDTRAGTNSPWAPIWLPPTLPADGRVTATATFSAPGTYVLRALADDGALTGGEDVTVTVTK
jgi:hypothetical protein